MATDHWWNGEFLDWVDRWVGGYLLRLVGGLTRRRAQRDCFGGTKIRKMCNVIVVGGGVSGGVLM